MKTGRSKLGRLYTRLIQEPLERVDVLSSFDKTLLVSMFRLLSMRPVFTPDDLNFSSIKKALFPHRSQSR